VKAFGLPGSDFPFSRRESGMNFKDLIKINLGKYSGYGTGNFTEQSSLASFGRFLIAVHQYSEGIAEYELNISHIDYHVLSFMNEQLHEGFHENISALLIQYACGPEKYVFILFFLVKMKFLHRTSSQMTNST
jgi:hypothetical protein